MGFVFVSLLLPGLIAALARPRRDIMLCVVVSAFALAVLTGQSQYIRYLYPIFPLLVVICSAAVSQLATVRPWRLPILALTTVVAGIGIYKLPSAAWFIQQTTLSAAFNSDQKTALLRAQVPVRLANTVINDMMARPRVIYALPTTYGAFLAGTPIYVAWYNSILTDGLGAATTTEAVKQIMDRQRADFIITEAFPIDFYMASRLAKVRAYAEANADLVTTIASVKIYKTRPR